MFVPSVWDRITPCLVLKYVVMPFAVLLVVVPYGIKNITLFRDNASLGVRFPLSVLNGVGAWREVSESLLH